MTQPVAVEIDLVPAEGSFPTSHRYYIREVGTEGWSPVASSDQARIRMAPHFAMEIPLHLSAAYPHEPWVEHFEWLEPMFNERLEIRDGRMWVPDRPGLGFSLSEQARRWTTERSEFGRRP